MDAVNDGPRGRAGDALRRRCRRRGTAAFAATVLASALGGAGSASAAATVAGGAFGINANVNALVAPVSAGAAPSISLPPEGGGPFTESLLSANVAGLAPTAVAQVATKGNSGLGSVSSSASVLDSTIAGVVTVAAARSRCSATSSGSDGSSSVVDLTVGGIPLSTVDVGPNTTIALPIGRVVVNEQLKAGGSDITVNAVRLSLNALAVSGDIVIAQSRCAVRPASAARARASRAAIRRAQARARAARARAKRSRARARASRARAERLRRAHRRAS